MAKLLKLRRGTTTQHASFTGAEGEVTIDTTKDTAVVHDGSTQGGAPLLKEDMSNLPAGTIDNADVNASAAISGTKISPDFGSQNITTTGDITTTGKIKFANMYASVGNLPSASTYHGMFAHVHDTGAAYYAHAGSWWRLVNRDSSGGVDIPGNLDVGAGVDVTGNITATGTIASNDITISDTSPTLQFTDTNNDDDFSITVDGGLFQIIDTTNSASRIAIHSDGEVDLYGHVDIGAGLDLTGNMTVTGTVDGRDVAADGSKLDGIDSGARDDQTKAEIDALNINADQVDGMHANEFLAVAGDTATGDITFSGGAGAISISANSDIRLTSGSSWTGENAGKIQHYNNHLYFQNGGGKWIFRNNVGTELVYIDSSGNLVASGNVTAFSDAKLKTDISTINDALSIVGKLRGVSYKWLKDGSAGIGVIAQEVEEVIPEVVTTNVNTDPATGTEVEVKSVDYGKIVGVLINAINELKEEVEELKNAKITG